MARQTVYVKLLDEDAGPKPRKYGVTSDKAAAKESRLIPVAVCVILA
jgi:hypothetical protein